jgi:hypothetical protein
MSYDTASVTRCVFEKIAQNVAQNVFCQNQCITSTEGKGAPKIGASSVIFKKMPKVNNHPMGEYSPNLVTLIGSIIFVLEGIVPTI